MNRRSFAHMLGGSLLTAGIGTQAMASASKSKSLYALAEAPYKMLYAPHFGMFKNHAGNDEIDQLKFMYDMGFRSLEDNGLMGRTPELQNKIGETMAKLGMTMGVFVLNHEGFPDRLTMTTGTKEWKEAFKKACKNAIETSKRVNAKWCTVVPGNYLRKLPIGIQTGNVIDSLKIGAELLEPHGLVMVLEPLSDTPDLFLRFSDQTYEICRAVGSPSCKILFDMYHMQRNEGNIIANINQVWDEIGYFQIGDNPGRKEPTTGEMNYKNIFSHIASKGYKGVYGMEHGNAKPGKEGEMALIKAYREVDLV